MLYPRGSYISEIAKFDASLHDGRISEMNEIPPDADSDRFPVVRNGFRGRRRRDIRSVRRCREHQGNVARIKMGDNLSCVSSPCKEQKRICRRIVNLSNIHRLEIFLLSQNRSGPRYSGLEMIRLSTTISRR